MDYAANGGTRILFQRAINALVAMFHLHSNNMLHSSKLIIISYIQNIKTIVCP